MLQGSVDALLAIICHRNVKSRALQNLLRHLLVDFIILYQKHLSPLDVLQIFNFFLSFCNPRSLGYPFAKCLHNRIKKNRWADRFEQKTIQSDLLRADLKPAHQALDPADQFGPHHNRGRRANETLAQISDIVNQVAAIQGADLLDDPRQVDGFRALCRLGRDKPFECVGEAGESRAALDALSRDPDWRDRAVVQLLSPELKGVDVPAMKDLLEPGRRHFIPPAVCARLGLSVSNHAAG